MFFFFSNERTKKKCPCISASINEYFHPTSQARSCHPLMHTCSRDNQNNPSPKNVNNFLKFTLNSPSLKPQLRVYLFIRFFYIPCWNFIIAMCIIPRKVPSSYLYTQHINMYTENLLFGEPLALPSLPTSFLPNRERKKKKTLTLKRFSFENS